MLTRRDFLSGLLSTIAAAALVKNGVAQPEQVIGVDCAEGKDRSVATVFDMAANTWRQSTYHVTFGRADTAFWYGWRVSAGWERLPALPYGMWPPLDSFGISSDAVAQRIRELSPRTECDNAFRQAVQEMVRLREYIDGNPS